MPRRKPRRFESGLAHQYRRQRARFLSPARCLRQAQRVFHMRAVPNETPRNRSYRQQRNIIVIVFDLGCENEHRFEGWFASNEDFERQLNDKSLTCPLCGSGKVVRLPHASYVNTGSRERPDDGPPKNTARVAGQYANLDSEALAKLIDRVIETTEDVGAAFPEEARKIHYREAPERHIRGTASSKEVEALKDEGIEVVALPIPAHRISKAH